MHFKPNMRKIQIAISSDLCIRLTWNLTGSCGQQQRLRGWSRMVVKQFQDGGRPPFWKSIYRHISVKNHPIFMKFCTQQQILNWMNVTWRFINHLLTYLHDQKWKSCIGQTPSSTERISCWSIQWCEAFHCNYGRILYHFRGKARQWSKIAFFHIPITSTPMLGQSPSKYCDNVWYRRN